MPKTYIFDTSVIITDPHSIKAFPKSDVCLPITVLDELDKLKKLPNSAGKNARVFMRLLDDISDQGAIDIGVLIDNDIVVKVDTNKYPNDFGDALYGDTRILACAYHINKECKDREVVFLSNDINLRVRAKAAGINAQKYEKIGDEISELYTGVKIVEHENLGEELETAGYVSASTNKIELYPNQFIQFVDRHGKEISKGRKVRKSDKIKPVQKLYPWGLTPRNSEQEMAIDLIMDNKIPLVTFTGSSGCGKSLVSLAAALELVINKKAYDKLIIYRPIQAVGNDIGYTPGSIEEKLAPWFTAIMDSFEILFTTDTGKWKQNFEMYKKKDKIQFEAMTYIRGRSIQRALIIVDEAQNIDQQDMKAILTRAGDGSKILLNGDICQIDRNDLDVMNNGLTYVIDKFKGSNLAGHLSFIEGQRSPLATEAAKIL